MRRGRHGEGEKRLMIQRIPHYLSNMVEAVLCGGSMAASGTGPRFVDDLTADRSVQGYMLC